MGDVIIRSDTCGHGYALGPNAHPAQIRYATYGVARAIAERWAQRQHVDVWLSFDGQTFTRLSTHRNGTGPAQDDPAAKPFVPV